MFPSTAVSNIVSILRCVKILTYHLRQNVKLSRVTVRCVKFLRVFAQRANPYVTARYVALREGGKQASISLRCNVARCRTTRRVLRPLFRVCNV